MTSDESCELPYSSWDKFRYAAEQHPVRIERITYGSSIHFHLLVRSSDRDEVLNLLTDASGRKLVTKTETESLTAGRGREMFFFSLPEWF